MVDIPNLSYINALSGGDIEFEKKLINIIKKEFPIEKEIYFKNLKEKKYQEVAENVHKLKHKISILGLENSYELAVTYENNLKEGSLDLKEDFQIILKSMTNFLNTL
ncbi:hypothetical protein NA63_0421 [Flavobacteriaceae bacterium MAR_2010_105]|nr:hypothetical protein NA63_0421 [Flavobacteriaceae bacterium MAR_2010_105]